MGNCGYEGECKAGEFLEENNFEILMRNFRSHFGEIDIIAKKSNVIVFVEVKSRGKNHIALPCESVNQSKILKIRKTASFFIMMHGYGKEKYNYRFDVIELLKKEGHWYIRHIENAF